MTDGENERAATRRTAGIGPKPKKQLSRKRAVDSIGVPLGGDATFTEADGAALACILKEVKAVFDRITANPRQMGGVPHEGPRRNPPTTPTLSPRDVFPTESRGS